jgi:hypothetical protein
LSAQNGEKRPEKPENASAFMLNRSFGRHHGRKSTRALSGGRDRKANKL